MLTKGNDSKVQNEVMAQIVADTSAKWMKFTRLLPKQEIEENSQYYTYMSQRVNIEEAIQSGVLGEAKDIAPGATLQELNVRKPISETISRAIARIRSISSSRPSSHPYKSTNNWPAMMPPPFHILAFIIPFFEPHCYIFLSRVSCDLKRRRNHVSFLIIYINVFDI